MCSVLAACWHATEGENSQLQESTDGGEHGALRLAVMPTLDCLPLYVADELDLFESEGASVALVSFTAQMDQDTALAGGSVHAAMTDLVRAERLQQVGTPLDYLTATQASWQLLTDSTARLRQLRQLDDKMLAMTRYSATDLLSDRAVDSARLKHERVFRIQVNDVGVRFSMLRACVMDAVLLPEPQATLARTLRCPVLMDTRLMDVQLGVLAVSQSVRRDSMLHHQTEPLLRAYDRAVDSINVRGLRHFASVLDQRCGLPASLVDSLPEGFVFAHTHSPRQKDIDMAQKWLKERTDKQEYRQ